MNLPNEPVLWLFLMIMGYLLVMSVLRVLGARVNLSVRRHNLIRQTMYKRFEYFAEIEDRENEINGGPSVIIEDEEPEQKINQQPEQQQDQSQSSTDDPSQANNPAPAQAA